MCGIVGYIGKEEAAPIILDCLSKLEYRGYDSAGMAVCDGKRLNVEKTIGKLTALYEKTKGGSSLAGTAGIGHTRWATHGEPSDVNAHPQMNGDGTIAVVHNGIIENYMKLKSDLSDRGYDFASETDTEVVAHYLDYYYKRCREPLETIIRVMARIEGAYALAIVFNDYPDRLYAVRKESPIVIGRGQGCNYIASDASAFLKYTRNVFYPENEEIACITRDSIRFFDEDGVEVFKEEKFVEWDLKSVEKGGYAHFMLKEMNEQPEVIEATMAKRIKDGRIDFSELSIDPEKLKACRKIFIVACGSAYHTGVTAQYVIEELTRIPVEVCLASEFRYRDPIMEKDNIVILVSQSGETADTKEAEKMAKAAGIYTIAVVNVVDSAIAREADDVIYTQAGPEIAVATTKAYSTQLVVFYMLAIYLGVLKGKISLEEEKKLVYDLTRIPENVRMLLTSCTPQVQRFANRFLSAEHVFFIGRGIDYAISLEASLKLKEISYIHSEAYAAGELKHGTISLIEPGRLVVALLTQPKLYPKTLSNIEQVKSRGAFVMAVTTIGNIDAEKKSDYVIYIPEGNPLFANSLAIIPLQLFAYFITLGKGFDVDKPRNLAKSVTVE